MPVPEPRKEAGLGTPRCFATTHWSVVLSAKAEDSAETRTALEKLCRTYWYPLYAYARRRGIPEQDAQDLTQGFFAQLLERQAFQSVSREHGRFRSFLIASFNYYWADWRDRARALKRGGDQFHVPLDSLRGEERYRLEPADCSDPARLFDRRWAMTVLDQAMERLRSEYQTSGKGALFKELQPFLLGEKSHRTYAEVGRDLELRAGAVKMAVLRLRQRYREVFRAVIAETVANPAAVDDELSYLRRILSS